MHGDLKEKPLKPHGIVVMYGALVFIAKDSRKIGFFTDRAMAFFRIGRRFCELSVQVVDKTFRQQLVGSIYGIDLFEPELLTKRSW